MARKRPGTGGRAPSVAELPDKTMRPETRGPDINLLALFVQDEHHAVPFYSISDSHFKPPSHCSKLLPHPSRQGITSQSLPFRNDGYLFVSLRANEGGDVRWHATYRGSTQNLGLMADNGDNAAEFFSRDKNSGID